MKVAHTIVLFAALTGAATCLFTKGLYLVSGGMNWTDAQTYCRNNYVDLLSVNSPEEDIVLSKRLSNKYHWIGLSKRTEERNYTRWSDESALGYTNWASDQPDGPDAECCVATYQNAWCDSLCENILDFLCYTWEPRLIVVQEMKTWEEALKHCRTFYTDLISLTTPTDLFAINVFSKNVHTPSFWTALRFLDGAWYWVNMQVRASLVLLPSSPAPRLRCGAQRPGVNVFENRDCEEKMNFVCYKSD